MLFEHLSSEKKYIQEKFKKISQDLKSFIYLYLRKNIAIIQEALLTLRLEIPMADEYISTEMPL
jgi:hypothetical protein